MAITAYGFTGTVDELAWSRMGYYACKATGVPHYVTGCAASSGGTGRAITIATGSVFAASVLGDNGSTATISLAANASGLSRIDYVIATVDWAANTVTFTSLAGTPNANPAAPNLTQTPGVLWQIPIARVTVRNAVSTIAGSDIEDCRPVDRTSIRYDGTVSDILNQTPAATPNITTLAIPDPGWPYRLAISAQANIQASGTPTSTVATGIASVSVDGTLLRSQHTPFGFDGPVNLALTWSGVRTGKAATVTLDASAGAVPVGGHWQVLSTQTSLSVLVSPA